MPLACRKHACAHEHPYCSPSSCICLRTRPAYMKTCCPCAKSSLSTMAARPLSDKREPHPRKHPYRDTHHHFLSSQKLPLLLPLRPRSPTPARAQRDPGACAAAPTLLGHSQSTAAGALAASAAWSLQDLLRVTRASAASCHPPGPRPSRHAATGLLLTRLHLLNKSLRTWRRRGPFTARELLH